MARVTREHVEEIPEDLRQFLVFDPADTAWEWDKKGRKWGNSGEGVSIDRAGDGQCLDYISPGVVKSVPLSVSDAQFSSIHSVRIGHE